MAFPTAYLADPQKVGAGEVYGTNNTILASDTFENGLLVGRFAKLDTGSIDNLDASVTPVIAGVVKRNVASPIEDGAAIDSALFDTVSFVRNGLVTVEVKAGQTPVKFGAVTAHNVADADAGKALATGGVATGYEFIEEVSTNVWLINK